MWAGRSGLGHHECRRDGAVRSRRYLPQSNGRREQCGDHGAARPQAAEGDGNGATLPQAATRSSEREARVEAQANLSLGDTDHQESVGSPGGGGPDRSTIDEGGQFPGRQHRVWIRCRWRRHARVSRVAMKMERTPHRFAYTPHRRRGGRIRPTVDDGPAAVLRKAKLLRSAGLVAAEPVGVPPRPRHHRSHSGRQRWRGLTARTTPRERSTHPRPRARPRR